MKNVIQSFKLWCNKRYAVFMAFIFSLMTTPALTDDAVDFSTLTAQISWSSVITAVLGICSGVALLYMAISGAQKILHQIRKS